MTEINENDDEYEIGDHLAAAVMEKLRALLDEEDER